MKFLSRLDDFEHIVIDGSVSGTGLSSLYLKDTATPILRIGNNTGDSFITYDGSELSISSDVDLRLTTPTDQDVFLITSSGNIITTQAGGTFTIGGGLTLEAITGGFLKADANGVVSVDNSSYLTNETDTLDSVTDRDATTTNTITVGGAIVNGTVDANRVDIGADVNGVLNVWDVSSNEIFRATATGVQVGGTTTGRDLSVYGNVYVNNSIIRVSGNSSSTGIIDVDPTYGAYRFYDGSTFRGGLGVGNWAGVGASSDIVQYLNSVNYYISNGTTALVKVESGGNVGIGTTSPVSKLHVYASDSGATAYQSGNDGLTIERGGRVAINLLSPTANDSYVFFGNPTAGNAAYLGYQNTENRLVLKSSDYISLLDSTGEVVRVDGGRVGVGTTAPSSILHVETADTVKTAVHISNTSTGGKKWDIASIGSSVTGRVGNLQIRNETDSANYVEITHDGNVGVGTETPGRKLEINQGGTGNGEIVRMRYNASYYTDYGSNQINYTGLNQTFRIKNNGSDVISFSSDSKVGIGTTSPSATLTVNGELEILKDDYSSTSEGGHLTLRAGSDASYVYRYNIDNYQDTLRFFRQDDGTGSNGEVFMVISSNGNVQFNAYGAGILKTDASGNVSIDTTTYIPTTDYDDFVNVTGDIMTGDLTMKASEVKFTDSSNNIRLQLGNITGASPYEALINTQNYHLVLQAVGTGQNDIKFRTGTSSGTDRMIINEAGNVGIGTTSPKTQLHLNDGGTYNNTDANNRLFIERGDHAYILMSTPDNKDQGIHFRNDTDNANVGRIAYQHRSTGDSLRFRVGSSSNNNEFLILNSDGTIQIKGYGAGYLKTDANGLISVDTDTIEDTLQSVTDRGATSSNTIEFTGSANAYVGIQGETDVNLKIGTGAGTEPRMYLFGSANGQSNAGNVFIGTANNTGIVDINGDVDVSGFAGFNGITAPDFPVDISSVDGGKVLRSTRGTSIFRIDQSNDGPGYIGMQSADDLSIQTNNTSKMYITSGGNVGIGTTSPGAFSGTAFSSPILDLSGSFNIRGLSADGASVLNMGGDTYRKAAIYTSIGTNSPYLAFATSASGSSSSTVEAIRITESQNVGIGTTSPSSILHIGSGTVPATVLDGVLLTLGGGQYYQASDGTKTIFMGVDASDYGILGTFTNHPLGFRTNNTERMRITSSGNVGIGTTNPTYKLTVQGSVNLAGTGAYLRWNSGDMQISNDGSYKMGFYTYNTTAAALVNRMVIDTSGNVGIGTTSPTYKFQITEPDYARLSLHQSTTGAIWQWGNDGSNMYAYYTNNGVRALDITQAGNVGIGTTAPAKKLTIGGSSPHVLLDGNFDDDSKANQGRVYFNDYNFGIGAGHMSVDVNTDDDLYLWTYDGGGRGIRFMSTTSGDTDVTGTAWKTMMVITSDADGGNVGIGTTSPTQKLDVAGNIVIPQGNFLSIRRSGVDNPILWQGNGTFGSADQLYLRQPNNNNLHFQTNGGNTRMLITGSGNVGIGTTSPLTKLHVEGGVTINTGNGSSTFNDLNIGGVAGWSNSEAHRINFVYGNGTSDIYQTIESYYGGANAGKMRFRNFYTNSPQTGILMTIHSNGKVGIGTDDPAYNLDVNSGGSIVAANFNNTGTTATQVNIGDSGNSQYSNLFLGSNSGQGEIFKSGTGYTYYGGALSLNIYNSNGAIAFHPNNSANAMFIATNGNVGIGTTSPVTKLDVAGDAYIQGSAGIGTQTPATKLHVVGTAETRLRVGSSNASSNVVLELVDENSPTTQGTVITYNNSTGETYFNNVYTPATTDFHFQSGAYGTATDFFSLSNAGGNSILHLSTVLGDAFITYENSTNEMELSSDGDLRLTTPTDQDVFFISSGGNIDMTQAGGTVDMGGNLVVDGDITGNSNAYITGNVGIGTTTPASILSIKTTSTTADTFQIDAGSVRTHLLGAESSNGVIYLRNSSNSNYVRINAGGDSYFNGGNVGIGTTSPPSTVLLDLKENTSTADLIIGLTAATGGRSQIRSVAQADNTTSEISFHTVASSSTSEAMRITSGGNVGIGTDNPSYKLTVDSGTDDIGILTASSDSGSYVGFLDNSTSVIPKIGAVGNKLVLDADNIGVGTTSPSYQFHIDNDALNTNNAALYVRNPNSSSNAVIAQFVGDSDAIQIKNINVGDYAIYNTQQSNGIALYDGTGGVEIHYNGATVLEADSNGGIKVTGQLSATGDVVAYSSDERLKENIKPIENAVDKIKQLKGVTFDWNEKSQELGFEPSTKTNDVGVIAQDVEAVFPQLVHLAPFDIGSDEEGKATSKTGEDYKTVNYARLTAVLIEAVKEQQQQIDELKEIINGFTK